MTIWKIDRSVLFGYSWSSEYRSLYTATIGMLSFLIWARLSSRPGAPHHRMPTMSLLPANSWYALTPAAASVPASRLITSTLRPLTPPVELSCWMAASSELFTMRPMKAPTPEKIPITPTLMVSPLELENPPAPAALVSVDLDASVATLSSFFLDEHAARKPPPSAEMATPETPALPAHCTKCRREIVWSTWRSMKSCSCSGVITGSTSVGVVETLQGVWNRVSAVDCHPVAACGGCVGISAASVVNGAVAENGDVAVSQRRLG